MIPLSASPCAEEVKKLSNIHLLLEHELFCLAEKLEQLLHHGPFYDSMKQWKIIKLPNSCYCQLHKVSVDPVHIYAHVPTLGALLHAYPIRKGWKVSPQIDISTWYWDPFGRYSTPFAR